MKITRSAIYTALLVSAGAWAPALWAQCVPCDPPGSADRAAAVTSAKIGASVSLMSSQVAGSIKSGAMGQLIGNVLTAEGDRQTQDALLQAFDNMMRQSTMAGMFEKAAHDFDVVEGVVRVPGGGPAIQRTSIPMTTCSVQNVSNASTIAHDYVKIVRIRNFQKAKVYNSAPRSARAASGGIRRKPADGWKPEKIITPKDDTGMSLNKQQAEEAVDTVMTLSNPKPLPALEGPEADTEQGKLYEAMREMYNARIAIGQSVLLEHTASITAPDEPTANQRAQADVVRKLWKKVDPTANPVTTEGSVSEAEWLNTRANLPYFDVSLDPDRDSRWLDELKGMNEKALLIEMLTHQATQMRIQYRSMTALEQIAQMMAVDYTAKQSDQANAELGELRKQVSKSNLRVN